MQKSTLLTIISFSFLSCSEVPVERNVNVKLVFDEVLLPIPNDLTNDWRGASFSVENGQKILHIYDPFHKDISQYSVDEKKVINRLKPFSDTLDPGNSGIMFKKLRSGYFVHSSLDFLHISNQGNLLAKWDYFIGKKNKMENWDYETRKRLFSTGNVMVSATSSTSVPLAIELTNVFWEGVFRQDFYEFDILSNFDFTTGQLTTFPIRFPASFNQNGKSYPTNHKFSFTGSEDGRIAYSFGIDENIHVLDIATGKVETHEVKNPNLPINIYPIDKASYLDKDFYTYEYLRNYTMYRHLLYSPYWDGFLRMAVHLDNGNLHLIYELINSDWEVVGQFEVPSAYHPIPIFFPNEIWFPFRLGYKPDEMKYYRVTIGE